MPTKIKYRLAETSEDYFNVQNYLAEKKVNPPSPNSVIMIAEREGKIEGVIALRMVPFIEPMIADNPFIATRLLAMMDGILINEKMKIVRCVTHKNNKDLFEKMNFEHIFPEEILMEKGV